MQTLGTTGHRVGTAGRAGGVGWTDGLFTYACFEVSWKLKGLVNYGICSC